MTTLKKLLQEKYWMSTEDIGRENQILNIVKEWLTQKHNDIQRLSKEWQVDPIDFYCILYNLEKELK